MYISKHSISTRASWSRWLSPLSGCHLGHFQAKNQNLITLSIGSILSEYYILENPFFYLCRNGIKINKSNGYMLSIYILLLVVLLIFKQHSSSVNPYKPEPSGRVRILIWTSIWQFLLRIFSRTLSKVERNKMVAFESKLKFIYLTSPKFLKVGNFLVFSAWRWFTAIWVSL